jgi:hypothetical protein
MGVCVPLERPGAAQDAHREPVQAADQLAEPAQRRLVAPLQVVDHKQQRVAVGDVDGQPVQRVEDRERDVAPSTSLAGPSKTSRAAAAAPSSSDSETAASNS